MRKKIYINIVCLTVIFALSCCGKENYHTKNHVEKQMVAEDNLMDFLVDKSDFKVGEGFTWNMDEKKFMDSVIGAEILDPDSEKFDETKRSTNEKNVTTLEPPIDMSFKDFDWSVSPIYVFNERQKLTQISYRAIFKEVNISNYKESLYRLINDIDNNKYIVKDERDFADLDELKWERERVEIKWKHVNENTAFRINSR